MRNMNRHLITGLAGLACFAATGAAWGQTGGHREAHAHVHGVADLSVVVDGDQVFVDFRSPLGDIVGFERAPKDAAERARADRATALLNDAAKIVVPAAAAECVAAQPSNALPFDIKPTTAAHSHDHDHGKAAAAHADVEASYVFTCRKIGALGEISVTAFTTFPDIKTAEAVFLGPRTQLSRALKASSPVFKLK